MVDWRGPVSGEEALGHDRGGGGVQQLARKEVEYHRCGTQGR